MPKDTKTDAAAAPATDGAATELPRKKRRWPLIAGASVVLAAAGGAAFWFLGPVDAASSGHPGAGGATADAAAHKTAPLYYKFDPAFVVNFGGQGNVRYLQIMMEAMSRDPKAIDDIKVVEPAIRNDLTLLFSAQQYEILLTQEGKEKLRQAALETVRRDVAAESGSATAIERVYFTSLVIQ